MALHFALIAAENNKNPYGEVRRVECILVWLHLNAMEFSEKVLVLQVGKFREADLWVRVLSPTRGLISAFAFGGSRSRKRFVGCLDTFNEIYVTIKGSGRSQYLALQEGTLVKGLNRLRSDWSRFGLAVNCVRFLQSYGVGPEGANESLQLMCDTLLLLEEAENVPRQLPLFFRIRLAFEQGYDLPLTQCASCQDHFRTHVNAWLFLREGQLVCESCARNSISHRMSLGSEALYALKQIREQSPVTWDSIVLAPQAARELCRAIDGFIQYHVGISWENGRFVRH